MNERELTQKLNGRYAVKVFDKNRRIPEQVWSELEKALILTPSSYGLQPWKFLVVMNEDLKKKLTPASWNQKQVESCSHYVVLLAKDGVDENDLDRHIQRTAEVRGVDASTMAGFKKGMVADLIHGPRSRWIQEWAARQVYIALGNFMTSAAVIGVDTCPMEGIDPEKYDEILNVKGSGFHTVVACAAGYRSPDDKYQHAKKVRFDAAELIVRL